jgi:hypothetical protein
MFHGRLFFVPAWRQTGLAIDRGNAKWLQEDYLLTINDLIYSLSNIFHTLGNNAKPKINNLQ